MNPKLYKELIDFNKKVEIYPEDGSLEVKIKRNT